MSRDVDIEFPAADVRALMASMRRAERELGASLGGGVKMAGTALARSMGASTNVAPQKRPYKVVRKIPARPGRPAQLVIEVERRHSSGTRTFVATIEGGKREANKSTAVRIRRAGMAKAAWSVAARQARTPSAVKTPAREVTRDAMASAQRLGGGSGRFRGDDPSYTISNWAPYIRGALKGGDMAAETAMRRAAAGLNHYVDAQLKRRFKAR